MKRELRGGSLPKAIATGLGVSVGITCLSALVLTMLTQKQSLWKGMPPALLCAALTQTLSVGAGTLAVLAIPGGKPILKAELFGAGYFLLLVCAHALWADAIANAGVSLVLCFGLPALLTAVMAQKTARSRRFRAPKGMYAKNIH